MNPTSLILQIGNDEKKAFDVFIKSKRSDHIRTSQQIVDEIFERDSSLRNRIVSKVGVSKLIYDFRELIWNEFLKDEAAFNAIVMKQLHDILETPDSILNLLIKRNAASLRGVQLESTIKSICGEYSGLVFPYLYHLSLSNTQSRRSRAGKTFEAILYKLYEVLGYDFDSQSKVGRKIFDAVGLGKKVDSILPSIEKFKKRRNKTIIGTMKTSLRERWQEVAEEIERTKIPEIHLLTADEKISTSKADEMSNHNIIVVAYSWVAECPDLKTRKNIISFEEYFFEEIPTILEYWNDD